MSLVDVLLLVLFIKFSVHKPRWTIKIKFTFLCSRVRSWYLTTSTVGEGISTLCFHYWLLKSDSFAVYFED